MSEHLVIHINEETKQEVIEFLLKKGVSVISSGSDYVYVSVVGIREAYSLGYEMGSMFLKQQELLTNKEAARLLRMSVVSFWKLRERENIQNVLLGKKIFFKRKEIESLIK